MDLGNNSDSNHDSDSESDENNNVLNNLADKARATIIPENSKRLYETQYIKFTQWCLRMDITNIDERVLLAYFQILSESFKATTLWTTYTKLKSMLQLKKNIDISKYIELQCFLKRKQKGHKVKKSRVFTNEEISKFLNTAPDEKFLLHKVALVIGLHGCLRKNELLNIKSDDIKREGSVYRIFIPDSKTGATKTFYTAEMSFVVEKYINLRPPGMERFFVQYRNGKCSRQNVGKGKLGSIPTEVANFLGLPNASEYTGHAIRRTSATLVVDQGADLLTLKRHGVWKSSTVAESYINDSKKSKIGISKLISSAINSNKREVLCEKNINEMNGDAQNMYHKTASIIPKSKCSMRSSAVDKYSSIVDQTKQGSFRCETFIVKPNVNKLTREEIDELSNISQEELQEVVTSDFLQQNQGFEIISQNSQFLDDYGNITQNDIQEVITTEFLPLSPNTKLKNNKQTENEQPISGMHDVTQKELEEVAGTDFLGNKIKDKPIYVFKNCKIIIHHK